MGNLVNFLDEALKGVHGMESTISEWRMGIHYWRGAKPSLVESLALQCGLGVVSIGENPSVSLSFSCSCITSCLAHA